MHAILYRRLRLSKEQEGLIYLQFSPAIFNARSGVRDKRSPCESRAPAGPPYEHVPKKLLAFFDSDMLQIFEFERFLFDHVKRDLGASACRCLQRRAVDDSVCPS
jgi:hypothetical protein